MKKLMLLMLFVLSLFANSDLIEIKQDIKLILYKVDKLEKKVDLLDKKVNKLDKKVEVNSVKIEMLQKQMDKRFEDTNKRFEDMMNYLWMISAAFLGLVGVTIGFAIWDRKSMIKAAKEDIIKDIKDYRLKEFVYKLKELATTDKELAKVLREFHVI